MAYTPLLTPDLTIYPLIRQQGGSYVGIIWVAYTFCGDPRDLWYHRTHIKKVDHTGGYYYGTSFSFWNWEE